MLIGITRVRNESLIIEDTLRHMLERVEHVVLYDDDSEDGTADIASSFDRVTVIHGTPWTPERDAEETRHRRLALAEAVRLGATWCLCFDADERLYGDLPAMDAGALAGYRFRLFDGYITSECRAEYQSGRLELLPRMWGPERRDILMLFRAREARFVGLDQREPVMPGPVDTTATYVRHYGKCISVRQWEETCEYYSRWPKYADKWNARRGKAVHTVSDFGRELYEWDELIENASVQVPLT